MFVDTQLSLEQILSHFPPPFWKDYGYWLSLAIGVGGLSFSVLAWREAKDAKRAALAAGRTVKLQTVAIELAEIVQKLDRVQPGIRFNEARDLIAETGRRVHRATAPFSEESKLAEPIKLAKQAVQDTQNSLKSVRPVGPRAEAEAPDSVYYGIETDCSLISNVVSDLIGLLEQQTFDFGDKHATS